MYQHFFKRFFAILLSIFGLIFTLWLFLVIAVAIKLDSPGPIFFRQKRVGAAKKHFYILKFRTMYTDAPKDMPTHLLSNPDQLITPVGRWLRKTSLDELPQLWNILTGDMAVVGPRPALWNQDDLIAGRDLHAANALRPGLTGWAQIHGRDELEISQKIELDNYYAQHISFSLDMRCFFGTIRSVLQQDGIVEGNVPAQNTARKIIIVTNHSYMLYQFRKELITELSARSEVILYMPFTGHEEDFQAMGIQCVDIPISRRGMNIFTDYNLFQRYYGLLKQERPDFVLTYSIKPNIYAGFACSKLNIPYYANVQGLGTAFQNPLLSQFVSVLYTLAFRKVSSVFFENTENANTFLTRKIISPSKVKVLKGAGINLQHYPYVSPPSHNLVHFLYLGRIMREKGMDELFSAARRLKAEGASFVLDLAGFFEDSYKSQVAQLEAEGIVCFHGFQQDPRPLYGSADCVVMPSYHEGMSNVLLEAASTGRVLITTDIAGCREAVTHGVTGLLCTPRDAESLYQAMKHFLSLSPQTRRDIGIAARRKMELEFDRNAVVSDVLTTLNLLQEATIPTP